MLKPHVIRPVNWKSKFKPVKTIQHHQLHLKQYSKDRKNTLKRNHRRLCYRDKKI